LLALKAVSTVKHSAYGARSFFSLRPMQFLEYIALKTTRDTRLSPMILLNALFKTLPFALY